MELNARYSGENKKIYHFLTVLSMLMYWNRQDLYAHILTASERIVTHDTFNELRWERDIFPSDIFVLSPGFQKRAYLFPEEFLEVLIDIHAMQSCRDSSFFAYEDTVSMMHVDNQQASVQSKLASLPTMPYVVECSRWAAYLAASMLCCKVWRLSVLPVSTTTPPPRRKRVRADVERSV